MRSNALKLKRNLIAFIGRSAKTFLYLICPAVSTNFAITVILGEN